MHALKEVFYGSLDESSSPVQRLYLVCSVQLRLAEFSLGESAHVWHVTAHASARASGLSNYQTT